jgi:hypothetical protein
LGLNEAMVSLKNLYLLKFFSYGKRQAK